MKMQKASDVQSGIIGLKLAVSGKTGAGKTTMGARIPDALILLTEPNGLPAVQTWNPGANVVLCDSADLLRDALKVVRGSKVGDHPDGTGPALIVQGTAVRTVVLDSVTDMQVMLREEMLGVEVSETGGKAQPAKETMTQQEWGLLIDRTARMIRAFRDLPVNLVALFLAEEVSDNDRVLIRPQLYGKKLPGQVLQYFSGAGYLYRTEVTVGDSTEVRRFVLWDGDERFLVKPVPGMPARTTPDLGALINEWSAIRAGTQPSHQTTAPTNGKGESDGDSEPASATADDVPPPPVEDKPRVRRRGPRSEG